MSRIGLNSNIFHLAQGYLDLLNNFLIDLNYSREIGRPYTNEEVQNFFRKLNEKSSLDPETQLIRSFFNRFYKHNSQDSDKELLKISQGLKNGMIESDVIKEIENLAEVLKFQCNQSYARMKGPR